MSLSISIHVDGYYGLVDGVPRLLDLFDKYGIKATFFVNMGREASIFQLLKYRDKNNTNKSDSKIASRYTRLQMLKIAFLSRPLGHAHPKILRDIKKRGHEVEPHCWSHLLWHRNFENINHLAEIQKMKKGYFGIFGEDPKGFVPPTWKYNKKVIDCLKKEGFSYISVKGPGKRVTKEEGLKVIPLSFSQNIEELLNEGKTDSEILEIYDKELKKSYVHLYFHADYEGIRGLKIFEEFLRKIKEKTTMLCKEL